MTATASTAVPAPVRPTDFLGFDELLDDEELMIRDTVRAFVHDQVLPHVTDWFEEARIPPEIAPSLGRIGVLGMHLSGYGCAGASATAYGLVCTELEAGDSGIRSLVSVQGSLVMFARQKMWITNGSVAEVAVVWARTDEGIRGFLVPGGTKGFTTQDIHRKLSLRASVTSELLFDDVRLPASAMLPEATSLRAPLSCLNEARYGIVWGAVGAARACFEAALAYSRDRVAFGRPIAATQIQQQKLATMALEINRAALLTLHLGRMKDQGRLRPEHVSMGKLGNVNSALEVARTARQMLGANGVTLEYPVIRHMNNLESVVTYEGTADVHALVVGSALTGIPAFR